MLASQIVYVLIHTPCCLESTAKVNASWLAKSAAQQPPIHLLEYAQLVLQLLLLSALRSALDLPQNLLLLQPCMCWLKVCPRMLLAAHADSPGSTLLSIKPCCCCSPACPSSYLEGCSRTCPIQASKTCCRQPPEMALKLPEAAAKMTHRGPRPDLADHP